MQPTSVQEKRTSAQQTAPATQTSSTTQNKYSKEVEQIVAEERDAKSKLPRYKGLERFELLEKMGECARPACMTYGSNADACFVAAPSRMFTRPSIP